MDSLNSHEVLLLNKSWQPIAVIGLKKAIKLLTRYYENGEPKAKILNTQDDFTLISWEDWTEIETLPDDKVIRGVNKAYKIPEIIVLTVFNRPFSKKVNFCKKTIFKRDRNKCGYCGKLLYFRDDFSIDHIVPKCKGGTSSWENCIAACQRCNNRKGNRTPEQAGMRLLVKPMRPAHVFYDGIIQYESWKKVLNNF